MGTNIDKESDSKKLFFKDFVIKLLWGFINKTDSLRQLSLELKTNESCQDLGLAYTPFSTLKDGFSRFKSVHFKSLFDDLLSELPLMKLPNIDEIGTFRVIDVGPPMRHIIAYIIANELDILPKKNKRFQNTPQF